MNTIILSFSLILIIFSFTFIILNNKKKEEFDEEIDKKVNKEIDKIDEDEIEDVKSSNYTNYINNNNFDMSNYNMDIKVSEGETNFSKVLDNTKEKIEKQILKNEPQKLDSPNDTTDSLAFNQKSKNVIDYRIESGEKFQKNTINKIIELSNAGLKAEEIAKITEKGVREVEIILKLQNIKNIN